MPAEALAYQALQPVAINRSGRRSAGHRKTQSRAIRLAGSGQHREVTVGEALCPGENGPKVAAAGESSTTRKRVG